MKFRNQYSLVVGLVAAVCVQVGWTPAAYGQFGRLKDAIKKGTKEAQKAVGGEQEEQTQDEATGPGAPQVPSSQPVAGNVVYSTTPIDPNNPTNLCLSFKAGDHIYGLILVDKPWRELLHRGGPPLTEVKVPIDLLVDGTKREFQYITIKKPEAANSKVLVLEIAPEPEKMTAYRDPGFFYGEGKDNRKIGPDTFTYNLSELPPGKHRIKFQVRSYADIYSAGEFTIEGSDYGFYARLREEVLKVVSGAATMPQAKKTDKALEATMRKLLENAGCSNVRKLVIVDKDWWLDRQSGGDSPIVSRHMDAAACTKADDGTYYYCICQFHQYKRIDGSFGPLELTHTGDKKPILEANIDK
jgi:hypothetical protein